MTGAEGLGRRLAHYRKRLGFDSTRALAARTQGRVSESVLQNIESGRKGDISVAQLLEISHALGISPLLLLAPLENPAATMDLPGLSDELASMTATEFDNWVRGTAPITAGRAPALLLRTRINQIRALVEELDAWRRIDEARRHDELVDPASHHRSPFTELDALAQRQREARIDQLYESLASEVDVGWVHRPWHNA